MNRGTLYAGLVVLIWSWVTIFITLLSEDFDVLTQNLYRYSAGSLLLLIIVLVFQPRDFLRARRKILVFLLLGLLVNLFQIVWVASVYKTSPTTAVLLSKLDVISIALLSALFFAAERRIVRNRFFVIGCALALLGVLGVVLGKGEDMPTEFDLGVGLLLLRSLIWALYIVSVRAVVEKEDPFITAAWVYLFASLFFVPEVLLWGDLGRVAEVPSTTVALLFGSGALCVGLGNALNFAVIKHLGSTLSATFLLVTPFTAGLLAYIFCDEALTATQIFSGIVIVLSCLLILRKVAAPEAEG